MLDIYTNCKIRLTTDKWISWENQCLGYELQPNSYLYELHINILRPFLQILVLTIADKRRFAVAVQNILGSSPQEWGSGQKKMATLREPDLNPTNFDNGKKKIYQGISTFSYSEFNPWILWMFTNLRNTHDSSPSTESPINSILNIHL